jgi:uncharacterized protein (DUF1501 family)
MTDATLHTRRQFLRSGLVGGSMAWTVPAFVSATMQEFFAKSACSAVRLDNGKDGPILVVVQLAGGNDGLNAIVPWTSDDYYRARPRLAVPRKEALRLDDSFGWHPGLAGLKELYDDGSLAVVHGVGYPNPNRSHFRSMEIWQTASEADRYEKHGWIGRYFDSQCRGDDAGVGIALSHETPQAFRAAQSKGITFQDPDQYRFIGVGDDAIGDAESEFFETMNAGDSIGSLSGSTRTRSSDSPLDFLERTALDAQVTSDEIRSISRTAQNEASYPQGRLANDLKTVARLIAGGMPTRIYYVSQGGYDTHTNQQGAHDRLLREFGGSIQAFMKDLAAQGNLDRVLVMGFSEFGRRVEENASGGTDHGAAAPVLLAGGRVLGGLHGTFPSLKPADLDRGDPIHTVDFRSIYASVLEQHLRAPSREILGRQFPQLKLIG